MKSEKFVVIVQESVIGSIIKDIFNFALFAGLMWFNHTYLSGSTFIDFLFIVVVIMMLIGRSSSKVYQGSVDGAIKFLQDKR
jgi:hypothetical protein